MVETVGAAKRSSAIASLTDSTSGTASATLAAGVGKIMLPFFIDLPTLADGDILTTFTPGFAGELVALDFNAYTAVTTAAKASTLNLEIGTTNVTGGALALTSANCTPIGAEVNGSAITAANTFTATDTISIEASSTTTFVEGSGWVIVTLRNMDTVNAIASLSAKINSILTNIREADVIKV